MGAWGIGVFSDDTACDIRGDYRDLIGDGHPGPEATDILLKRWAGETGSGEWYVFWLALAATQWKCGRLEERVKNRALEIIDARADLTRWEDESLKRRRNAALQKLRVQLLSQQPSQRKIAKPFRDTCDWAVGELIGYELRSKKWIVLRVTDLSRTNNKGSIAPVCEILNWEGDVIPKLSVLEKLSIRLQTGTNGNGQIHIGRARERELPLDRIKRLGLKTRPSPMSHIKIHLPGGAVGFRGGLSFVLWRFLDRYLEKDFGLK
jgi:hypothetical protein